MLRRVAQVYEKRLGDRDNAYEALQVAWMEDFGDVQVRNELERITALTQKWNELLTVANEALQQTDDPETKINICLACGKWYGEALNHPEYAIPYYQQVLALDPGTGERARRLVADARQRRHRGEEGKERLGAAAHAPSTRRSHASSSIVSTRPCASASS